MSKVATDTAPAVPITTYSVTGRPIHRENRPQNLIFQQPASCNAAGSGVPDREKKLQVQGCYNSENSARDEMKKNWAKYNLADRNDCVSRVLSNQPASTYTELSVCLLMKGALRDIAAESRKKI